MLNDHLSQIHTGSPETTSTPWYRRERWLVVCMSSVLPVVGAIFAPQSWKVPLAAIGGLLMSASMLMLLRQQQKSATRDDGERSRRNVAGTSAR